MVRLGFEFDSRCGYMGASADANIAYGFEVGESEYDDKTYEVIPRWPGEESGLDLEEYLEKHGLGEEWCPVEIERGGNFMYETWPIVVLRNTRKYAYGYRVDKFDPKDLQLASNQIKAASYFLSEHDVKLTPSDEWSWIIWGTYG